MPLVPLINLSHPLKDFVNETGFPWPPHQMGGVILFSKKNFFSEFVNEIEGKFVFFEINGIHHEK